MNQLEILIGEMTIADLARTSGKSVAEIAAYVLGGEPALKPANGTSTRAPEATNGTPKAAATAKLAADILAALGRSDTPLLSMDLEKIVCGTTETRRHVYICPGFFKLGDRNTRSGRERRAGVFIHELVHRLIQPPALVAAAGLLPLAAAGAGAAALAATALPIFIAAGHPLVKGKRVGNDSHGERARRLAKRRPIAARRSPVNYQLLALELGTGRRQRPT